ncbi:MAG: hypothetical protein J0L91_10735, partial [Burkholderiales bacterium]|nr:hypothetical protein [Burkholderiales bacterium]
MQFHVNLDGSSKSVRNAGFDAAPGGSWAWRPSCAPFRGGDASNRRQKSDHSASLAGLAVALGRSA